MEGRFKRDSCRCIDVLVRKKEALPLLCNLLAKINHIKENTFLSHPDRLTIMQQKCASIHKLNFDVGMFGTPYELGVPITRQPISVARPL